MNKKKGLIDLESLNMLSEVLRKNNIPEFVLNLFEQ